MPPARPATKATKKRKVGNTDPSQPKLDRFLSSGSSSFNKSASQQSSSSSSSQPLKDEPMQIDSPPSSSSRQLRSPKLATVNVSNLLGTFRQQSLIPCIAIASAQPARSKTLPESFFNTSWETQKTLIVGIFSNAESHSINFVTASKLCENLCRYGKAQDVYEKLKKEIEDHVLQMKAELLSIPVNVDLLLRLNQSWSTFCNQLSVIRNVFMELDRSFILPNTKFSSIIQLGKHIFSDTIMDTSEFRAIIVAEVLKMIKLDRDNEQVDIRLIQSTLQMMIELSFYALDFEPRFLSNTKNYYNAESSSLIHQLPIPQYIEHANKRRSEESNDRIQNYLDIHTKQPLINVVTEELIYSKVHIIVKKGFEEMMENMLVKPLGIFYELLSPNPKISLLRSAFGEYIKEKGVQLIRNPEKDPEMIINLINFKRRLDHVLQNCFDNDTLFQNAVKESFEYLINTRGNKPAELLAKFIDSKLKPVPKRAMKSDSDSELLDNALVLFRYIQGKDAFEAYYKRFLAKRLLMDRSSSRENEGRVIEKLKLECGHEFTKNLENMFQDIKLSIDLNIDFKGFEKETPRMPINVKVIQQSIWPASPASDILLPPAMLKSQQVFERFYVSRHKGKKLLWQNSLSNCNLTAHYPEGTKELVMTLYQAAILLLFNDSTTLSLKDMVKALNLEERELKKTLSTLTTCKVLLVNDQNYTYNSEFTSTGPKFKVPKLALDQAIEETKNVEEKLFHNRQHQVDAAVVRIMKERKTCSHTDLVTELLKQLNFPVEASDVKKRIESLIDKDYLARDTENPSIYIYQS